jgi:hypothetical protein
MLRCLTDEAIQQVIRRADLPVPSVRLIPTLHRTENLEAEPRL